MFQQLRPPAQRNSQVPFVPPPENSAELAALLNAPPEPDRPYVYRGTRCHINKFGILNPAALEKVIRSTTRLRAESLKTSPIDGDFDLDHLRAIHHHLFQDVYDWAGELRLVDFHRNEALFSTANGATEACKSLPADLGPPTQFTSAAGIASECRQLFDELAAEGRLCGLDRPGFVERGVYFLSEVFRIHPFRDGNGRTTRTFFHQLAAQAGWDLDLDRIAHVRRHVSAYRAHCGDPSELTDLFDQSLRDCQPHEETA